ncbi:MAG: hypothetical protein ACTSWR_00665 [Candidatus Helarchaeota archaeon]
MSWDAFFKNLVKSELINANLKVEPDVKVGKLPLIIDLVIIKEKPDIRSRTLTIITKRLKKYNIFEFKSARDKQKESDIPKLTGYCGLYCQRKNLNIIQMKEITSWYIVSRRSKFIKQLNLKKLENGLYCFNFYYPIYFLVINELDIKKENISLLIFSSGLKLKKSIELIVENKKLKNFLSVAFILYPNEVTKIFTEKELTMDDFVKNIRYAIEVLGLKNVIESVGINKVIEEIGIDKVIEEIGIDKVIEEIGIDKVIEEIGIDKVIEEIGINKVIEEIGIDKVQKVIDEIKSKNNHK